QFPSDGSLVGLQNFYKSGFFLTSQFFSNNDGQLVAAVQKRILEMVRQALKFNLWRRSGRNNWIILRGRSATGGTSSSTPAISSDIPELKDMVKALLLDKKNQSPAPTPSTTPAPVKAVEPNCYQNLQNQMATLTDMMSKFVSANTATSSGSGTLPGTKVTKDQVQTPSSQNTVPVQLSIIQAEPQASVSEPVVAPVSASMPNLKPSIPYPSRRNNKKHRDQANEQIKKFYEVFKEMSFEISFTDALILMQNLILLSKL
nr:reverse transcriptase domain-containing protein [Tanacetum cinerariifolium]